MFSRQNEIKLEINNNNISGKISNIWSAKIMLQYNLQVEGKIINEI